MKFSLSDHTRTAYKADDFYDIDRRRCQLFCVLWVRRNVYVSECFADFDGWDVYGVALPEVQAAEPAGDAGNRHGTGALRPEPAGRQHSGHLPGAAEDGPDHHSHPCRAGAGYFRAEKAGAACCSDVLWTLAHPEGYYVWEYDWAKAPTFGNRDNREDRLTISLNAEVPGATMIEIRARYEDWVQGKATEKANWVGPDFGKKAEE